MPYMPRQNSLPYLSRQLVAQFVINLFVSENDVNDLLSFFFHHCPNDTIPPKLHFLEDHAADFEENGQQKIEFTVNREQNLSIKFSVSGEHICQLTDQNVDGKYENAVKVDTWEVYMKIDEVS